MRRIIATCLVLGGLLAVRSEAYGQTMHTHTVRYVYDANGRLTRALYGETAGFVYSYDAAGNLIQVVTGEVVVGVEGEDGVPARFALHAAYPNPFNPATTIAFEVKEPVRVRLVVHDVLGRRRALLVDEERPAGRHEVSFDGHGLPSGLYLYTIEMGAFREARTMLLVR